MRSSQKGFSLIELSVVLVLISLATAMVLPNLSSAYGAIQLRTELDKLTLRLSSLSYDAYSSGQSIRIENQDDADKVLAPSDDWTIKVVTPIIVTPIGVCLGGDLLLSSGNFEHAATVLPPYCHVERESR